MGSKVVAPEEQVVPEATTTTTATPALSIEDAARDFFMWKNPMQTMPWFLGINFVFYLLTFRGWSVMGLVGSVGMAILVGFAAWTKFTNVQQTGAVEIEEVLTPAQVKAITNFINNLAYQTRLVLRCDDVELFAQAFGVCAALALTGWLLSPLLLIYTASLLAFVGPTVYAKHQSEIDAALLKLKVEAQKQSKAFKKIAEGFLSDMKTKIGSAAKAAAQKAQKKVD